MMKVVPLPVHRLIVALEQGDNFAAAMAPLLPATHLALGLGETPLRRAVVARILYDLPVGGDEKHFQPHVDAALVPGGGQRFDGHLSAGDTRVPAIRFAADGDRLGGALERTVDSDGDTTNLRQAQQPAVQRRTAMPADLRIGETDVAVRALETWITRLITVLHATEE